MAYRRLQAVTLWRQNGELARQDDCLLAGRGLPVIGFREEEMSRTDRAEWLAGLRPAIQDWIGRQCSRQYRDRSGRRRSPDRDIELADEGCTRAYADLTLAYGLAWLGHPADECRRLVEESRRRLEPSYDDAHAFLFGAYAYRIGQALEGTPGRGSLPAALLKDLERLSGEQAGVDFYRQLDNRKLAYTVDSLRRHSRILEPHGGVNPYRHWSFPPWHRGEAWLLCDVADGGQLAERIRALLQAGADRPASDQVDVLTVALALSPRISRATAEGLLACVTPLVERLPRPAEQAWLIQAALTAAADLRDPRYGHESAAALLDLLGSPEGAFIAGSHDRMARDSIHALRRLGLWQELSQLVDRLGELILQGDDVAHLRRQRQELAHQDQKPEDRMAPLRGLVHVAGGWLDLGRSGQALQVLDEVWNLLLEDSPHANQVPMSWAYTRTLGRLPAEEGRRRSEEIFRRLEGVIDTFTTRSHYAVGPIQLVESLVLAFTAENIESLPPPSAAKAL